jgi:hypothetical protein
MSTLANLGKLVEFDENAERCLEQVCVLRVRHVRHTTRQIQAHPGNE